MSNEKDQRWQSLQKRLASAAQVPEEIRHLVRAVAGDQDLAMTHDECLALLPEFVDAEVNGYSAAQKYPQVKRHLDLCDSCQAEYIDALKFAQQEAQGAVPFPDRIPKPDLSFLSASKKKPADWLAQVQAQVADALWSLKYVLQSQYILRQFGSLSFQTNYRSGEGLNVIHERGAEYETNALKFSSEPQVLLLDQPAVPDQRLNVDIKTVQAPNAPDRFNLLFELVSSASLPAHLSATLSFAGQTYTAPFDAEGRASIDNVSMADFKSALDSAPDAITIVIEARDHDDHSSH